MNLWSRAAVLATAGALLAAVPASGTASATSAPRKIGTLYNSTIGIPKSLKAGKTIYAHTWYRQTSRDRLVPYGIDISVWSRSTTNRRGISVGVLDPVDHRWHTVKGSGCCDFVYSFNMGTKLYTVASNRWARVDFRVTFSKSVRRTTWRIEPEVPTSYSLLTSTGRDDSNYVETAKNLWQQFPVSVHS